MKNPAHTELLNTLLKDHFDDFFAARVKEIFKEALREVQMEEGNLLATQTMDAKYLDRKSAAKKLGLSLPTLDQYTKEGIIKARRIGKKVLYIEQELISSGQEVSSVKYKKRYDQYI